MARPRVADTDAVLDAAADVLADRGVAATTVDDVAAAAGVSRATVYRYLGGKDEIVAAVIGRETQRLLADLEEVVGTAPTAQALVAALVVTVIDGVDRSPVLHRLNNADRRETLRFITVDGAPLIAGAVASLGAMVRERATFAFDPDRLDVALEEGTRLVLSHLTTPRADGDRLDAAELAERAATMVLPLLEPGPS